MPVVALATRVATLTREEIRRWLRDYPLGYVPKTGVINSLLDNVEFSDDDIDAGIQFTVDRYNILTPFTTLTALEIPRALLLYGTVAHLLQSEHFRQLRNETGTQDGDVQLSGVDAKQAPYLQASSVLMETWQGLARGYKTQRNAEGFYGGLGSGYINISRTYGNI